MHSNILGAYCEGELVGYGSLLLGYGIWADFMYAADSQRSLKKLRYPGRLKKFTSFSLKSVSAAGKSKYSRTLIARTTLEPGKYV